MEALNWHPVCGAAQPKHLAASTDQSRPVQDKHAGVGCAILFPSFPSAKAQILPTCCSFRNMTIPSNQSHTPAYPRPSKAELRSLFVGKTLSDLRTPTAIVDVARVERNCVRMLELAQRWGVPFRAHIKTHKTLEGSLKMLSPQGQTLTTSRAIAATLPEAWGLIEEGCAVDPKDVELMKRTLSDVSEPDLLQQQVL